MAERFVPDPQQVLILSGLPGSGKTKEALEWVNESPSKRTRINYDELRLEMFGPDWKFNRQDENKMKERALEMFDNAMRLGMSVVIDNTNLKKSVRDEWAARAKGFGVDYTQREIDTDIWTCIKRDGEREGRARVGRAVIERMALFHGLIDWDDKRTYPYDGYVVCDLDGTLADISHRRHFVQPGLECPDGCKPSQVSTGVPDRCFHCSKALVSKRKDWKSFFANISDDKLNESVADLLDVFIRDRMGVLLVSGRPIDQCGKATEDWLAKHKIRYDHLFMRNSGDSREDTIIKREILDLLPIDEIDYVLDDRDQVVKMWRDAGLFCLQVAEGSF